METETVKTVRIPKAMDLDIQKAIDAGMYKSFSEYIREAARLLSNKHKAMEYAVEIAMKAEASGLIEVSSSKEHLVERRLKRKTRTK